MNKFMTMSHVRKMEVYILKKTQEEMHDFPSDVDAESSEEEEESSKGVSDENIVRSFMSGSSSDD